MPILYVVGGLVSVGLLVYLVVALLKPEVFSMTANGYAAARPLPDRPASPWPSRSARTWRASTRAGRSGWTACSGWLERLDLPAVGRPRPTEEMGWKTYALRDAALQLRWACCVVYLLQRLQGVLPLNPQGLGAVSPDSSFNTAVSFATNTNWQGYGGETTMSYLTQMLGADRPELRLGGGRAWRCWSRSSAASRAARRETIGNFWVDLTRTHALHPAAAVVRAGARARLAGRGADLRRVRQGHGRPAHASTTSR